MASTGFTAELGQDQFLKLLVAQMKSQNPMEPTSNQEFLGQLAQFSTLNAMETMNANFNELLTMQQLSEGSSLLGKQVAYTNSNNQTATGAVQSIAVTDGKIKLQVGGDMVGLDSVVGIAT